MLLETWRAGLRKISASTWSKPAGTSGPLDSPRAHRQAEWGALLLCRGTLDARRRSRGFGDWLVVEATRHAHPNHWSPAARGRPWWRSRAAAGSELARGPSAACCLCFCGGILPWREDALEEPGPPGDPTLKGSGHHIVRMLAQPVGKAVGGDVEALGGGSHSPVKPSDEDTTPHLKYNLTQQTQGQGHSPRAPPQFLTLRNDHMLCHMNPLHGRPFVTQH